ncbi:SiaB family protein kinase [Flexithrix dorotheae]|uniref:SiaB family protein kinase n=1 Tax=Flexithrix dorotheae TaxID=70993 RepID=UPI00036CF2AC|nr:SiaB family protein kinase [Flexithrix dorotheae]
MTLNANITKSVLTFYHEMMSNGISLVYLGEFNQEITKMFTSMAEDEMKRKNTERSTKKRVYHVMVETLQNMNKHSDGISEDNVGKGLFMIGKKDESYYVITSNKISNHKIAMLQNMIEEVNAASKDELKQMYMKQIKEGRLSDKGGAGLGIIDIARKTGEKYQYQFLPIDDQFCFFILKVEVRAKDDEKDTKEKVKTKNESEKKTTEVV